MSEYSGSINNEEVGKRIKEIRESNNLTQEQMAEILKVTPNAVRDYEKGNYGISKDVMLRLKQSFHISIDNLMFGADSSQDELLSLLENTSEENKMRILMYLMVYFVKVKKKGSMKDIDLEKAAERFKHLFGDVFE